MALTFDALSWSPGYVVKTGTMPGQQMAEVFLCLVKLATSLHSPFIIDDDISRTAIACGYSTLGPEVMQLFMLSRCFPVMAAFGPCANPCWLAVHNTS